jgi:hypothetical protein
MMNGIRMVTTALGLVMALSFAAHVSAFGGPNPADKQFPLNPKQSSNDASIVDMGNCINTNGGVGIGQKTVKLAASTQSNRKARYLAVQGFWYRNGALIVKFPAVSPYDQYANSSDGFSLLSTSTLDKLLCIELDRLEISSYHKALPLSNDINPGSQSDWIYEKPKRGVSL